MSHSSLLSEEVDTIVRLSDDELRNVFTRIPNRQSSRLDDNQTVVDGSDVQQLCEVTVGRFIQQMTDQSIDLSTIANDVGDSASIPADYDRILLGIAKDVFGRMLDPKEKVRLRKLLRESLNSL